LENGDKMSVCLEIQNLSKSFNSSNGTVKALDGINLTVEEGEFISIVGASGCGKSTLLRIISGLESHDAGTITLDGKPIYGSGPDIGMIFQESRLFPWMTIGANIEFGMNEELKKQLGKKKVSEKVDEMLELVDLKNFKKSYPHQLSGGMQQRISIARSLIGDPRVLLLDEPLGALDALTRMQMQNEILRIWKENKKTMILVTHDIDEAIYLGDRVVVLSSRPGTVKKIFQVELARPRKRSAFEFIQLRQNIYKEFYKEHDVEPEYFI
jgi:sulfonate transport system ATP-binding protein